MNKYNINDDVWYESRLYQVVEITMTSLVTVYTIKSKYCTFQGIDENDLIPYKPHEGWAKLAEAFGKAAYDLRTNSCPSGVPEDSLSAVPPPKFKVGDAVYFDRKKWDIEDVATNEYKIRISDSAGSCTREFRNWTVVKESDLRLWKKTELTHILNPLELPDKENFNDYAGRAKTAIHIGTHISGLDMFSIKTPIGESIYLGTKGDDIS